MTLEKKIEYIDETIASLHVIGDNDVDLFGTTFPALSFLEEYKKILEKRLTKPHYVYYD